MTELKNVPDFFVVGAPKCATSSLHGMLAHHPDVFVCNPKEPHYFCTDFPAMSEVENAAEYDALFAAAPKGAKKGDASAFYLSSKDAPQNIHAANPQARIIISIRNPADAVHSWYHQLRDGFREDQTDFEAAWDMQATRRAGAKLPLYCPEPFQLQYEALYSYHDQIARYFDVFGRDAVKVLRVEQFKTDPENVAAGLFSFIGVDPAKGPGEIPRTNTRRQASFPGLTQFLTAPHPVFRPLLAPTKKALNALGIKPSEIMMKYMSRPVTAPTATLNSDLRNRLTSTFDGDVARLETLLEVDLSHWRAPA